MNQLEHINQWAVRIIYRWMDTCFFLWWHNRKLTRMVTEPRTTEHCSLSSAQSLYCSRTRSRSYWFHAWLSTLSLFCSCLVQRSRFPNLGACWDSQQSCVFSDFWSQQAKFAASDIPVYRLFYYPQKPLASLVSPMFLPDRTVWCTILLRGAMQGWHGQMPGCLPGAQARRAEEHGLWLKLSSRLIVAQGIYWLFAFWWLQWLPNCWDPGMSKLRCAVTNMIEPLSGVIWFAAGPTQASMSNLPMAFQVWIWLFPEAISKPKFCFGSTRNFRKANV